MVDESCFKTSGHPQVPSTSTDGTLQLCEGLAGQSGLHSSLTQFLADAPDASADPEGFTAALQVSQISIGRQPEDLISRSGTQAEMTACLAQDPAQLYSERKYLCQHNRCAKRAPESLLHTGVLSSDYTASVITWYHEMTALMHCSLVRSKHTDRCQTLSPKPRLANIHNTPSGT